MYIKFDKYMVRELVTSQFNIEIDTIKVDNIFLQSKSSLISVYSDDIGPSIRVKNLDIKNFTSIEGGILIIDR